MSSLLEVQNLKTWFYTDDGIMPSVDSVSLKIKKEEALGLVGESGCGKTMLSLSIIKLIPPPGKTVSGSIMFYGGGEPVDIIKTPEKEMEKIRGSKIAMIFQDPLTSLNPVFSIEDQMTCPLMIHQKLSKKEALDKAVFMLEKVGISGAVKRIKDYPHHFSGGQRQRIMIASALSLEPLLLIADEPTTALDVSIQAQILDLLEKLQEETKTAMIFISHNLGVIADISQRVAVMYGGWIVEEAPADKLFANPLHPYTQALLQSIPSIYGESKTLSGLPGRPPSAGEDIKGCRLHPRCPKNIPQKCCHEKPQFITVDEGHKVRCFIYE